MASDAGEPASYDGAEYLVALAATRSGSRTSAPVVRAGCVSAAGPSRFVRSSSLTTKAGGSSRLLEEMEVRGRRVLRRRRPGVFGGGTAPDRTRSSGLPHNRVLTAPGVSSSTYRVRAEPSKAESYVEQDPAALDVEDAHVGGVRPLGAGEVAVEPAAGGSPGRRTGSGRRSHESRWCPRYTKALRRSRRLRRGRSKNDLRMPKEGPRSKQRGRGA